ncbi:MAG: LexA family protein [Rubrivivax sp.]|jgi:DNA polymerase V
MAMHSGLDRQDDGDDFPYGARAGASATAPRPRDPQASAGFGSPGSDFTVKRIDLNEALIQHPQATFIVRATGHAMADAGVCNGDVLLVDRAEWPQHGHLVIAKVEGELLCRRLVRQDGVTALETAETPVHRLVCDGQQPLEVWGVVTTVIRQLRV